MAAPRRLGLQRRIMLYVTIGLAAMFAIGGVVGSAAIDQATSLVFDERLATAYTTAGIVERDFARLAADVRSAAGSGSSPADARGLAARILTEVDGAGQYPFFVAVAVCLAGPGRAALAEMGTAVIAAPEADPAGCAAGPDEVAAPFQVAGAAWQLEGEIPLGDVLVPLAELGRWGVRLVVVRLVSINHSIPFDPASFGAVGTVGGSADGDSDRGEYNLEIIDQAGFTVLAVGRGEHFGAPSPHFPAVKEAMAAIGAAALVDPGDPTRGLEPHVMAVVPLNRTPFLLLLEQPTDVALVLPNQLRAQLIVLVLVGFIGATAVAWFTTRRVVQPTERLTAAAEQMAQGDLTGPIDVEAQDEIAVLAETLDAMRLRLRDALLQLEQSNRELEQRVAERTARLGQVLRKMISAQEDERHALARELHDETAQTLAALSMALDGARDELGDASPAAQDQIRAAKSISVRLLDETRRLILGLRPSVLDDLGLGPAIAWYAEATLGNREIDLHLNLSPTGRLPTHLEASLFRIAQEAINNVAKHAQASGTTIRLRRSGGEVLVAIEDDGAGFAVDETLRRAPHLGSVGLAGMQERAALLDGRLEVSSTPGAGTRIAVIVPLAAEDGP